MSEQLYQQQRQHLLNHPLFSWPGLGAWSFYFLLKIGAGLFGYLELNLLWNVVLLAFLVIPVHPRWLRPVRQLIGIAAAVILLYQEAELPPFSRLLDQWELVSSFSGWYLLELVGRFISVEAIAVFLVALILFMYVRKILRMTAVSLALLLVYPVLPNFSADTVPTESGGLAGGAAPVNITQRTSGGANDPDSVLARFYAQQQQVQFSPPSNVEPNFDILLLNICSLSWQDLEQFELLDHPLWESADILLSNFYTGSSYSGPATLRLLQASCGHVPHSQLFEPEASCTINEQLSALGFESEIRMNHTGAFDNYLSQIRELGGMGDAPFVPPEQFPIAMTGFDQSPIRADSAVLGDWLGSLGDSRKFTFYNTTSLHDGNRLPGFRGNSIASYRARVNTLLDDTLQLFAEIEASGRNVLVVMVPEHGAGLQGDRFQLPGMREIPTPALTHVPVLFKLFGEGIEAGDLVQVGQPTGPSAISEVIYEIMRQQPFNGGDYRPEDIGRGITETLPVLENDRVIMLNVEGQFFLQINNGEWRPYNR
ncbi:cellulose biosynthesis protein BcsG [Aliidiomarina iranensis]|uniref:Cellulose biosynthesis protein BcsG n=1 Tax=Aliidiomarina iranensis TaxID=1434071 RepID=A0A432VT94_9GAMM|nr:cellulose biosynthesis protein BcsG [Aliidiomarina iranensis]RUO19649.1 cellulose biosynthesis protein BcsG [Aliidiomarina iranensis]